MFGENDESPRNFHGQIQKLCKQIFLTTQEVTCSRTLSPFCYTRTHLATCWHTTQVCQHASATFETTCGKRENFLMPGMLAYTRNVSNDLWMTWDFFENSATIAEIERSGIVNIFMWWRHCWLGLYCVRNWLLIYWWLVRWCYTAGIIRYTAVVIPLVQGIKNKILNCTMKIRSYELVQICYLLLAIVLAMKMYWTNCLFTFM